MSSITRLLSQWSGSLSLRSLLCGGGGTRNSLLCEKQNKVMEVSEERSGNSEERVDMLKIDKGLDGSQKAFIQLKLCVVSMRQTQCCV